MKASFFDGYIRCALWASTNEQGEPLDTLYGRDDFADETIAHMHFDCDEFELDNAPDLLSLEREQVGHDFWLTRNGHGTGFWDRGLGEVGERLSQAAHVYGECDLYVGDDGKLYVI